MFYRPLSTRSQPQGAQYTWQPWGNSGDRSAEPGPVLALVSLSAHLYSTPSPVLLGMERQAHVPMPGGHAWGSTKYQESAVVIASSSPREVPGPKRQGTSVGLPIDCTSGRVTT